MTEQMDLTEFVAEAKRLRAAASDAEREFFLWLRAGEEAGVHEGAGCTFVELLDRNDLCKPARYQRFCRTVLGLGLENCAYERNVDIIACANMLVRDGQPSPIKSLRKREKEIARTLAGKAAAG